jgi:hypothetical protein
VVARFPVTAADGSVIDTLVEITEDLPVSGDQRRGVNQGTILSATEVAGVRVPSLTPTRPCARACRVRARRSCWRRRRRRLRRESFRRVVSGEDDVIPGYARCRDRGDSVPDPHANGDADRQTDRDGVVHSHSHAHRVRLAEAVGDGLAIPEGISMTPCTARGRSTRGTHRGGATMLVMFSARRVSEEG